MSEQVIVNGSPGSSYVQAVLLALVEKAVAYQLQRVDTATIQSPTYRKTMHPFGRIPVFEHGNFRIYETQAILRYIDEAFAGPALQPDSPRQRARMNQAIGVLENYSLSCLHGGGSINFNRVVAARLGLPIDEAAIAGLVSHARACLLAFDALVEGPSFGGERVNLADPPAGLYLSVRTLTAITVPDSA